MTPTKFYSDIFRRVAEDLNLPYETVHVSYHYFWRFVKKMMNDSPFDRDYTEEEFRNLRTSFNIPSLGKLACTYDNYVKVRERKKHAEHKESKTSVHENSDNHEQI